MESTSDLQMAVSKWTKWFFFFFLKREVSWKVDSKKTGPRRQGLYMFCNNLSFDSCQFCCLTLGSMWWAISKGFTSPCPPPVVVSAVRWHRLLCVLYKKLGYYYYYFFLLCHMAVWFLVPHSWMESVPPTVEAHGPNYWTTGSLPQRLLLLKRYIYFLSCLLWHVSLSTLHIVCCYFTFHSQESCLWL